MEWEASLLSGYCLSLLLNCYFAWHEGTQACVLLLVCKECPLNLMVKTQLRMAAPKPSRALLEKGTRKAEAAAGDAPSGDESSYFCQSLWGSLTLPHPVLAVKSITEHHNLLFTLKGG